MKIGGISFAFDLSVGLRRQGLVPDPCETRGPPAQGGIAHFTNQTPTLAIKLEGKNWY